MRPANEDGSILRNDRQVDWHRRSSLARKPLNSNELIFGMLLAKLMTRFDMPRTVRSAFSALLLLSLGASACVIHEAEPAFRATVLVDHRGISIPLPPPSLVDEPDQEVEVDGEVVGLQDGVTGLVVRITDSVGEADVEIPLADGESTFHAEGVLLDLTDNCLEIWLRDADGREGDSRSYRAVIDPSDDSVSVVEGCD